MTTVQHLLGLSSPPAGIAFLDAPPDGVPKWEGAVPAGCAFWRQAMNGKSFYTVPSDHYNCAVGSHTHSIRLPSERAAELEQTVGFMVRNNYIRMEEVPGIPTLPKAPAAIAYGPAGETSFAPDVFVVAANPAQAMLLYEAAIRAGAGNALTNILGRPGCASLPLALASGVAALSFGCKGNRTFTGLTDSELYFVLPASHWDNLSAELATVAAANLCMRDHYQSQSAQFPIL
jgi:uncharacterized protein (DUF169 family)